MGLGTMDDCVSTRMVTKAAISQVLQLNAQTGHGADGSNIALIGIT